MGINRVGGKPKPAIVAKDGTVLLRYRWFICLEPSEVTPGVGQYLTGVTVAPGADRAAEFAAAKVADVRAKGVSVLDWFVSLILEN